MLRLKKKFSPILFVCSVFTVVFLYMLGSNLNSTILDSKLYNINKMMVDQQYCHTSIMSEERQMSAKDAQDICLKFNRNRYAFLPYYSLKKTTKLVNEGSDYPITFYSNPVYSDTKVMEWLELPLYFSDYSHLIKAGPKHGANFASYLPASIAERIMVERGLNSFDQLIDENHYYEAIIGETPTTISINNIYLDCESEYWNDKSVFDKNAYYHYFGEINKSAVFVYGANLMKSYSEIELFFDIQPSYSHYEKVIRTCLEKHPQTMSFVFSKTKNLDVGKNNIIYLFSNSSINNNYTSKSLVLIYFTLGIFLIYHAVILIMFKDIKGKMLTTLFAVIGLFAFVAMIGEFVKTITGFSVLSCIVFNAYGNILSIAYFSLFAVVAVLLYGGKNEEVSK